MQILAVLAAGVKLNGEGEVRKRFKVRRGDADGAVRAVDSGTPDWGFGFGIQDCGFGIRDQRFGIRDSGLGIVGCDREGVR
jgi:hypothetical protein